MQKSQGILGKFSTDSTFAFVPSIILVTNIVFRSAKFKQSKTFFYLIGKYTKIDQQLDKYDELSAKYNQQFLMKVLVTITIFSTINFQYSNSIVIIYFS